jgi:hypothetical protein
MIRYDAKALQKLADKLYGQSTVVVAGSAVAGVITGGLFSYAAALIFQTRQLYLLPGAIAGGVIGFFVGRQRARAARLQAQVAACLIQIEENTRRDKGV